MYEPILLIVGPDQYVCIDMCREDVEPRAPEEANEDDSGGVE